MTAPDEDLAHADIGLVCALPLEVDEFLKRCERVRSYTGGDFTFKGGRYDKARIAVVESGVGQVRAARATRALIEAHSPKWVISIGFAGGLLPEMRIGHIAVADSVVEADHPPLKIDLNMHNDPMHGLFVGTFVTVNQIVRTVVEKKELASHSHAIAVDMESHAVGRVCQELGTRFMAVRVLTDDLTEDLPPEVLSILGKTGSVRMGAVLGSLWKHPGSLQDMWKLRERAMTASTRLASFLDGVVTQLYAAEH